MIPRITDFKKNCKKCTKLWCIRWCTGGAKEKWCEDDVMRRGYSVANHNVQHEVEVFYQEGVGERINS